MMKLLRWIYEQMGSAPNHILGTSIPMAVSWYIGRHALWWMFVCFYAIETGGQHHFGRPPHPESEIAYGEVWIAWLTAYATGSFVMYSRYVWWSVDTIATHEGTSPTLLYLLAGPRNIGAGGLLLLPLWMILFAPYCVWQLTMLALRLLGFRALIAHWLKDRRARVIDISAGSPWRSTIN